MNKNKIHKSLIALGLMAFTIPAMAQDSVHYAPPEEVNEAVRNVVFGAKDQRPEPPALPEHHRSAHEQTRKNIMDARDYDRSMNDRSSHKVERDSSENKKTPIIIKKSADEEMKKVPTAYEVKSQEALKITPEVAHPTAQPVVVVEKQSLFTAKKGERLSSVLGKWASQEDWSLYWSAEDDFILPADMSVTGNVETVFTRVGEALSSEGIDYQIKLYKMNNTIVVK